MENSIVFKVILLGDHTVGKTCFINRYCKDTYNENQISTVGIINYKKN